MKIRKSDMNKLVMNFLVTEGYVDAAEKFRIESGTERILSFLFFIVAVSYFWGLMHFVGFIYGKNFVIFLINQ